MLIPLIAAIDYHSTDGVIGEIKDRNDTERFEITEDTREVLPTPSQHVYLKFHKLVSPDRQLPIFRCDLVARESVVYERFFRLS